jgi:hypothetical protein
LQARESPADAAHAAHAAYTAYAADAAHAASDCAAHTAAYAAEREWQINKLRELLGQ